jgi:multimeric flavodoxin WrbA
MTQEFVDYLKTKKKVLFLTTSNRWDGDKEQPKSTQLAYDLANEIGDTVTILEIPKLNIFPCEGNVSTLRGNSCGLKDSVLKDKDKNPTGYHRCWASINNPTDELWKVSKELFESDAVLFFISVRWGQANSIYQKLIERLNWIENMHTTLGEENEVKNIEAGCVVIGQNWRTLDVLNVQKEVYRFYGFQTPDVLSFNWQYTQDVNDETAQSYIEAPYSFQEEFKFTLKGLAKKVKESMRRFFGFNEFLNEAEKFPHEIKSETFWKQVLKGNDYALKVLDTVMKKQKGFASDRQMEVLDRVRRGDKSPYPTKN